MAKKDEYELDNILRRTEPATAKSDNSDLNEGKQSATGVALTVGETAAIDALGAQLGELLGTKAVSRNALLRLAARRLILAIRSGELSMGELAAYFEKPETPRAKAKF